MSALTSPRHKVQAQPIRWTPRARAIGYALQVTGAAAGLVSLVLILVMVGR